MTLAWLYPDSMSIYGDRGNVIALQRRAEWRGMRLEVWRLPTGERLDRLPDLVMFGGGQDREQRLIERDFLELKGEMLREAVEQDVPVLAVCGGFQLLGHGYRDADGTSIEGLGILDATTIAPPAKAKRCIGNVVVETNFAGTLVGFENHGGRTTLGTCQPLGRVLRGFGNNGRDHHEGARYRNCLGTYMHGSLLPKNPVLTDWLLEAALRRHNPSARLEPLDDMLEQRAHAAMLAKA
ncbi:MAG: gamma-glutamyl-gamma-aminobutyrate hydrolase family protein [Chloroflexi bacterium]|nr:gamma-glutamyl-gamma-aminobutyrate hydrolase family protein [Chloroflexota bacterium]